MPFDDIEVIKEHWKEARERPHAKQADRFEFPEWVKYEQGKIVYSDPRDADSVRLINEKQDILIQSLGPRFQGCGHPCWNTPPALAEELGRFVPHWMRKSITADREVIDYFYLLKGTHVPSFMAAGPREHLFFNPGEVTVGILTAGGNCPGLNTVIDGIVSRHYQYAKYAKTNNHKILGFIGGWKGLANDFRVLTPQDTVQCAYKGGSILMIQRDKYTINLVDELVGYLKERKLDILYAIGGDGTVKGACALAQAIKKEGVKTSIAVLPKSIDNDLSWIWETFGFRSAVEVTANHLHGFHTDMESIGRIGIVEVMGRDCGALALNAAAACGDVDIVIIREAVEKGFTLAKFICELKKIYDKNKHALILVAEGVKEANSFKDRGIDKISDYFRKEIEGGIGAKVEIHIPGYSMRGCDPNFWDQNYCRRLAFTAVDQTLAGYTEFMVSQWLTEYVMVPIQLVALKNKYIHPDGSFYSQVVNGLGQPKFFL